MGSESPEHAPHCREALVVVERLRRIDARRHGDRQHDVAIGLPGRLSHRAAHGLHDLHMGVPWAHEQHRVQRRHVDPLGQAPRIREDAGGAVGVPLQPFDPGLPVQGVVLAVHVAGLAAERLALFRFRQQSRRLLDDPRPIPVQSLRHANRIGEGDGPREGADRTFVGRRNATGVADDPPVSGVLRVRERSPATDDLRRVGHVDLAARGRDYRLKGRRDVLFGHAKHDDLVVREQALIHRPRERKPVKLVAVEIRVVHREDLDLMACSLPPGALRVEPRRCSHVKALRCLDSVRIVHQNEGRGRVSRPFNARRAVRFVAEDQVEPPGAIGLSPLDQRQRLVGTEHDGHFGRPLPPKRTRDRFDIGRHRDL